MVAHIICQMVQWSIVRVGLLALQHVVHQILSQQRRDCQDKFHLLAATLMFYLSRRQPACFTLSVRQTRMKARESSLQCKKKSKHNNEVCRLHSLTVMGKLNTFYLWECVVLRNQMTSHGMQATTKNVAQQHVHQGLEPPEIQCESIECQNRSNID